jgi:hypothetical protein
VFVEEWKGFALRKIVQLLNVGMNGAGMFLKAYILKLGFLDGLDGFMIAITMAGGSFLKYAKLLELQRKREDAQ